MNEPAPAEQTSAPAGPPDWHALAPDAVAVRLRTDAETGLGDGEARTRFAQDGPNELQEAPPPSPLTLFLRQFSSLVIWVLIAAAVVSGFLHEWVDAGAILTIVLLNALLGFIQEFKAEQSLAALRQLSAPSARVVRDGALRVVPARELVPGDLIHVEAGDHIPADARLIYAAGLRVQEAALTGESVPVDKSAEILPDSRLALADRRNMLYLSTAVTAGKGRALIVATGGGTELGRLAVMIRQAGREDTPLQRRLDRFGLVLLYLSLAIVSVVFFLGLLRGEPLIGMFLTAVSLAVAAIPEGLPAIVTITLALGVTRMAARHALIRRLPAVETLGSTTVICSDKTGTLTKNEMTVTRLFVDGRVFEVTGEGYEPKGEIRESSGVRREASAEAVSSLLTAAVLCNDAELMQEENAWRVVGDPTEGALLVAAAKLRLNREHLETVSPLLGEIPFDSGRKMMTVVRRTEAGPTAFVKGAPDVLVGRCTHYRTADGRDEPLTDPARERILAANRAFARDALRVIGVASRLLPVEPVLYRAEDVEQGLTFLGLVAMKDPLRQEAIVSVRACREAGIRVVMITGDHRDTAEAIARELDLLDGGLRAIFGVELDALTDDELARQVEGLAVYARVSAEHKLRIVRAWKSRGAIVAMTGDGVNDAPAVKEADIGVAMGLAGTDVTKEASDMVVTDDNFASIAAAVEEGRAVYDNIRKAIQYLLSCNVSEVLLMLFAALLALPLPLLPAQILWINLVTDGLPALALAVDPKSPDLMRRQPRPSHEHFLTPRRVRLIFGQGLLMAAAALLIFMASLSRAAHELADARTLTFTVMVLVQLLHAFSCRSDRRSILSLGLWTNKPLLVAVAASAALQAGILLAPWSQTLFKVAPLTAEQWLLALGFGLLPLVVIEGWKVVKR